MQKIAKYFLTAIFLLFLYLSFITIKPLVTDIILGLILTFMFYPIYNYLLKKVKNKNLTATIMILIILLLIIIPGVMIVNSLLKQTISTYNVAINTDFDQAISFIPLPKSIDISKYVNQAVLQIKNIMLNYGPSFLSSIFESMIGLFIMFFIMFYAFRDGDKWIESLKITIPMKKKYFDELIYETKNILSGVLYGYILAALIVGVLLGALFFIFKIPNPVFWGFIMIILAMIPLIGTFFVWIPAALYLMFKGSVISGVLLIILGGIISNIDVILRPKLISGKANINPVLVIIGVFGGIMAFGFSGMIIGPLILTLLPVVIKFFKLESQKS